MSIRWEPMSPRTPPPSARVWRHWIGVAGSINSPVEVVHECLADLTEFAGLDQLLQVPGRGTQR